MRPEAIDGLPLKTIGYSSGPIFAVPLGRITFCVFTALEMSAGERPHAKSFCRSRSTTTWRTLPPTGRVSCAPCTVARPGRRKFVATSKISCSLRVGLDKPSWRMGTLEALYAMTSGGIAPGGNCLRIGCETAATWETAPSSEVPGCM